MHIERATVRRDYSVFSYFVGLGVIINVFRRSCSTIILSFGTT